jgi:hypothetical protein
MIGWVGHDSKRMVLDGYNKRWKYSVVIHAENRDGSRWKQ